MTPTLDTLLAERAIERQLKAYCRAMDRCDQALGEGVFHAEARVDYGTMFRGTGHAFVAFAMQAHLQFETHLHRLSNVLIEIADDRAGSESYVDAQFRTIEHGLPFDSYTRGRYLDRWEQRDGAWRITHRTYVNALAGKRPLPQVTYGCSGSRDVADPSYALLAV